MKKSISSLIIILLFPLAVKAATLRYSVSYTEPTTNADGTTITDLASIVLYYDYNGIAKTKKIAASSPVGGKKKTISIYIPVTTGITMVNVRATAVDISGNESGASATVTKTVRID